MESTKFSLNGKTILITGASSGIGKQTAIDVSKAGANLILTARNKKRLAETLKLCKNGNHKTIIADLTKQDDINNLILKINKLDGIVHSAGIADYIPAKFINEKNIYNVMDINYKAPVILTSMLLKKKSLNKMSSIVFISSISSIHPAFGSSQYSSSKSAIEGYSRTLAIEVAAKQIRSNCLLPSLVKTEMILENLLINEEAENNYKKQLPLGYGTTSDIANASIFLLSDEARWITGQSIKMGNF